jgi:hypothetical protein
VEVAVLKCKNLFEECKFKLRAYIVILLIFKEIILARN